MNDRINYLIECSRTAREELLFRVKHRDNWLKLQLYVQAILLAVSNGIKLGAETSTPFPSALALSLPISFVFVCLYFVEDHLISKLSKYVGSLSDKEMQITNSQIQIYSWDNSRHLVDYAKGITLKLRSIAQLAGFIILPVYLALLYYEQHGFSKWEICFQISLCLLIIILIILGYNKRKTTG